MKPSLPPDIAPFMEKWHTLPRLAHPILPQKKDINPVKFGEFLPLVCITEMVAPRNMQIRYAGTEFEHLAGFKMELRNYYDMLPPAFVDATEKFHQRLISTPCGAYVCDLITSTNRSQYLHETVHLPLTDEQGAVRFLMVFGVGNKPQDDRGNRRDGNHNASNIKELQYLDLGSGAPGAYVTEFQFHNQGA